MLLAKTSAPPMRTRPSESELSPFLHNLRVAALLELKPVDVRDALISARFEDDIQGMHTRSAGDGCSSVGPGLPASSDRQVDSGNRRTCHAIQVERRSPAGAATGRTHSHLADRSAEVDIFVNNISTGRDVAQIVFAG